ncbi:MAG: hypothetical protein KGL39_14430 [Patescibacteria group bacterium]|nr:hypothetical protein [Patescibacteria group bacterium]
MMKYLALLFLLVPARAFAARTIMEQTAASANTIFIDTQNIAVDIATAPPMSMSSGTFNVNGTGFITGNLTAPTFIGSLSGNATTATSASSVLGTGISSEIPTSVLPSTIAYTSVPNTFTANQTITSTMTVLGNAFSVGASTLVVSGGNVGIGNVSPSQALSVNGNIVGTSSITASAFFGDGSNLSGVKASIPVVTSSSFGVVGDGVTDDSVTLQNFLDDFSSHTLVLECGNYYISHGVTIVGNGTPGNGQSTGALLMPPCAQIKFQPQGGSLQQFSLTVSTVDYSRIDWNTFLSSGSGVELLHSYRDDLNVRLINNGIHHSTAKPDIGQGTIGVYVPGSNYTENIYGNKITGSIEEYDDAVILGTGTATNANGEWVDLSKIANQWRGVTALSGDNRINIFCDDGSISGGTGECLHLGDANNAAWSGSAIGDVSIDASSGYEAVYIDTASVGSILRVNGNVTIANEVYNPDNTISLTNGGSTLSLTVGGNVAFGVGTPTLSSCGTGPGMEPGSNDVEGEIATGTGATTCTMTFSKVRNAAPVCIGVDGDGATLTSLAYSTSASAISFTAVSAGSHIYYFCPGL